MTKRETFYETYLTILEAEIAAHPDEYAYTVDLAKDVATKMVAAYAAGDANTGPTLKKTCRALGIKPTLTAVKAYLETE